MFDDFIKMMKQDPQNRKKFMVHFSIFTILASLNVMAYQMAAAIFSIICITLMMWGKLARAGLLDKPVTEGQVMGIVMLPCLFIMGLASLYLGFKISVFLARIMKIEG